MNKKENLEKRILNRKSNQITQLITDRGFPTPREVLYWEREESAGPDSDLSIFSNSSRTFMTYFNFELPLSRLEFINVKSLYDLSFETNSLNIFAGTNSSGKSSILETIAMLSKWSFTSNNFIRGIPFGSDFGTLSFKEFKSFNTGDEPSIISMEFDNVIHETSQHLSPSSGLDKILGKLKVTIELNDDSQSNKSNKILKYAPISKLAININQDKAESQSGDLLNFVPIDANLEFVYQSEKEIRDDIKFIEKVFKVHLKQAPNNTVTERQARFEFIKTLQPGDFPDHTNLEISDYSSYADIEVAHSNSKNSRKTRLYGNSFNNSTKRVSGLDSNSPFHGYVPIKKDLLVKWLAFDYIMSNKRITKYLLKDLLNEEMTDKLMTQRKSTVKKLLATNKYKEQILDDSNSMMEVIHQLSDELGYMDLDLNLIMEPRRERDSEVWLHIEATYDFEDRTDIPISINGYFDSGASEANPLIAWFEGDTTLIREFEQQKYNNIELISEEFTSWKETLHQNYEHINNLLSTVSPKVVNDAIKKFDSQDKNPMGDVYKKIDTYIKENKVKGIIPLLYNWSSIKFSLLEYLSEEAHSSDTLLAPVVASFQPELDHREIVGNEATTPLFFYDSFNNDFISSIQRTLSSTIFVGPLRERYLKDEEVFSFSYPFLLGKMGELSGSFLGTYGDTVVEFPAPDFLIGESPKKQTYFEHLSDWLEHIGVADNIFTDDGYIFVSQNNNKLKLENVGVGVSQVLPVLLSCMIKTNPENNEIILLEQPELHLHPSAQANLADFFIATSLSGNKNLFIETHSEHVVNRIKTKKVEIANFDNDKIKIYFASKNGDETELKSIKIGTSGEYVVDDYPDGFFDQAQKEAYSLRKKITKKDKK